MGSPPRHEQGTIAVVIRTRPEIIKLAPVIHELKGKKVPFFVIHTNQHFSTLMSRDFFQELSLDQPKFNLAVGSGSQGLQTAKALIGIEGILRTTNPSLVVVQGDTNSTLAGSLAAAKLGISLCHVEAGLRSFDRSMPEELNRILSDHCSQLLLAPTQNSADNLK